MHLHKHLVVAEGVTGQGVPVCPIIFGLPWIALLRAFDIREPSASSKLPQVLGSFKTAYFDYKAKAAAQCPSNPWRIQNNAIFARMDLFLERCHDVLDLTTTITQFQKVRMTADTRTLVRYVKHMIR